MTDRVVSDSLLARLTDRTFWGGSGYELSLEWLSTEDPSKFTSRVLEAIWHDERVTGALPDPTLFGQARGQFTSLRPEDSHVYGLLWTDDGRALPCGTIVDPPNCYLYVPLQAIEHEYRVTYPLRDNKDPWSRELNYLLVGIAARVYQRYAFILGAVGEEVGGYTSLETLTVQDLETRRDLLVPETVFAQLGIHPHGSRLSGDLWWTGMAET